MPEKALCALRSYSKGPHHALEKVLTNETPGILKSTVPTIARTSTSPNLVTGGSSASLVSFSDFFEVHITNARLFVHWKGVHTLHFHVSLHCSGGSTYTRKVHQHDPLVGQQQQQQQALMPTVVDFESTFHSFASSSQRHKAGS